MGWVLILPHVVQLIPPFFGMGRLLARSFPLPPLLLGSHYEREW